MRISYWVLCFGWLAAACSTRTYDTLYSDAEVREILRIHAVDFASEETSRVDLHVVPNGEAMRRQAAFEKLGVEEVRLGHRTWTAVMHVACLSWRLSPSYDLVCMTATNEESKPLDENRLFQPDRSVYGFSLRRRTPLE